MLVLYVGILAYGLNEFRKTPIGFIPQVDRGYLIVVIQLPAGSSLSRTDEIQQRVVDVALKTPGVAHAVNIVGFNGATFTQAPNSGAVFLTLEPWDKRGRDPKESAAGITAELFKRLAGFQEALILVIQPPPVAGVGNAGGVRMMVEDRAARGSQALLEATTAMVTKASQTPGLTQVFTLFENSTPQIYLDIDRTTAQLLGVTVADVFGALQVYIGSAYVNDFNLLGRTYRVTAQADSPFRATEADVANLKTRSASGAMVPIGSVATFQNKTGPYRVVRYNLHPAVEVDGDTAPGFSSGRSLT